MEVKDIDLTKADFSGWATKAGLKCSDGRTIMPNAFLHQDSTIVPLVYQHGHKNVENVLGHAVLENKPEGVYCYGFFNDTAAGTHAKGLVQHRDIKALSIWANELVEKAKRVMHGAICEVSLVLKGANPGALIENVALRHSDGSTEDMEDEAIIYTGLEFEHAIGDPDNDGDPGSPAIDDGDGPTVQEILDSMTDDQQSVTHYLIGEAIASVSHSKVVVDDPNNKEGKEVKHHNVFENDADDKTSVHLSHDDVKGIMADALSCGSLKTAVEDYALKHGIEDIDILFPPTKAIGDGTPAFVSRRMEWVEVVLSAVGTSPFSRIKTLTADLTFEDARAKGYIKGNMKKEEFIKVAKRETFPQTVYKKQKLDRDDILDITTFDVITWLKGEMRIMLDEEIARAILIGDGRDAEDDDRIDPEKIRPIAFDDDFYAVKVNINIDDSGSSTQEIIDAVVTNRAQYRGSGTPAFFTTERYIARFLLLKDSLGRRIYQSLDDLAAELRVSAVIPVEAMESMDSTLIGVIVNLTDYNVGTDAGGQVNMFDFFDIDFNQQKYLIETRCSGALTRRASALVLRREVGTNVRVVPTSPSFDPSTGALTITDTAHVVYKNSAGTTVNHAGSPYTVASAATETITATPAAGYYFDLNDETVWSFTSDAY